MENKLELRVGDVVRLHNGTIEAYDQTLLTIASPVGIGFTSAKFSVHRSAVAEVISRAETDAEKIARLEAENAELRRDLQASEQEPDILINARGICPCEPDRKVVVWLRSGEKVSQDAGCFRWKLDLEKKDDDVFAYMVLPQ